MFEKYGCALYTVAALSALMEPDDRICPIVHVRKQDEAAIKELLAPMPNVDLTGIRSDSDRGDVVELTYTDQNTRLEHQTGFMSPILPRDVEFVLDAEAFVCVPITDYEVGQATLEYIRANSDGVVLLDGHGPVSTLTIGGERQHRLWAERDAWLPSIDILKMNLEEAGCSWFPREGEDGAATMGQPMTESEMPRFAEHCLRHGVRAVCVTLDEQGCVAYRLDGDGKLEEHIVPRVPGGERRRHHGLRRLVRRGHGLRLPLRARHREGLPVRQRDGRPTLRGLRAVDLPAARRDRRADRAHLRPDGGSGTCVRRSPRPSG